MPDSHAPSTQRDGAGRPGSTPDPRARLADLGPFFAVHRHVPPAGPAAPWRPLDELARPGVALDARVQQVRAALAARGGRPVERIDRRVAVSVAHLGLVARLIAPAIGAATLGESMPVDIARLWWQDELGGPYPLSVADPPADPPVDPPADPPADPLTGSAVEAITRACLAGYSVSPRVLWGNVASAAASAAGLIGAIRPDLAGAARRAADEVLADQRVESGALRAGPGFRRRSCCLIYRLAGSTAAVCGDCVIGTGRRV